MQMILQTDVEKFRRVLSRLVMFAILLLATNASAQHWYWIGSESSNWSDANNWNSAIDGGGDTPVDIVADFADKNVMLLTTGAHLPSNQDVVGLAVDQVTFPASVTTFGIFGKPLQINTIKNIENPPTLQSVTFWNDLILNSSSAWSVRSNLPIIIRGAVSEIGGRQSFAANDNGRIYFHGPVTISGGFRNNQTEAHFYGMNTTGAHPTELDADYFITASGMFGFNTPDGKPYEYEFDENIGAQSTGRVKFDVAPSVVVTFNGVISENQEGRHFEKSSGGVLYLNAASEFTGSLNTGDGLLFLNAPIADGIINSSLWIGAGGTVELNGYNAIGRSLSFANGSGFQNSGNLRNSNMSKESIVSGDIASHGSYNNVTQFGGAGDIMFLGNMTNTTGTTHRFAKVGAGKLTLAGEYTYNGPFEIMAGTLCLDYGLSNTSKIGDAASLALNANLTLLGNGATDSVETIGPITINSRAHICPEGRNDNAMIFRFSTLNLGRNSNVNFAPKNGGMILTSGITNNPTGIIFPRMTFNGETFARVALTPDIDGYYEIEGFPNSAYTAGFDHLIDTEIADISSDVTVENLEVAAALRFNTPQPVTLTIKSDTRLHLRGGITAPNHQGGILVTENVGTNSVTIEGGLSLCGTDYSGTLQILQYNTAAPLIIGARINEWSTDNQVVKCGPGELVLTNTTSQFVNTYIYEGTVTTPFISNGGTASPVGSSANFNIGAATFKYIGESAQTDRTFTLHGHATINASGSGPFILTKPTSILTSNGNDHRLTLTGTGEGEALGIMDLRAGSLRKTGSGTWTLGAPASDAGIAVTNLFWGGTIVEEGKLIVNCALGRDVTVAAGGTLAGAGAISHDLTLRGTLEVNPDNGVIAVGHNTIIDGATLAVAGGMIKGEFVEVLRIDGKVIGEFANVPSRYKVRYAPNSIEVQDKILETLIIVK